MFPKEEIIELDSWHDLCDCHFENQNYLKSGLIHCHLEKIPELFKLLEQLPHNKYVVISSASDAGLHYHQFYPPAFDFYKACFLYLDKYHVGNLHMLARFNKDRYNLADKYSIKYYSYTECTFNYIPDNVKHWFVCNCTVEDERITNIPLGVNGKEAVEQIANYENKERNRLLYVNFEPCTIERVQLMFLYKKFQWATAERKVSFIEYLNQLATHVFTLCPSGNGYETHRLMESIYMGSIPIVEDHMCTKYLLQNGFPVLVAPSLFGLTKDKLISLSAIKMHFDTVKFSYWKNKIQEVLNVNNISTTVVY